MESVRVFPVHTTTTPRIHNTIGATNISEIINAYLLISFRYATLRYGAVIMRQYNKYSSFPGVSWFLNCRGFPKQCRTPKYRSAKDLIRSDSLNQGNLHVSGSKTNHLSEGSPRLYHWIEYSQRLTNRDVNSLSQACWQRSLRSAKVGDSNTKENDLGYPHWNLPCLKPKCR